MSPRARERYQARWLARLIQHAWEKAPGVRRRLEHARLTPRDVRSAADLTRLPVIKKSEMPDLQKVDPPFGGFCTVPLGKIRRIFVSPGPILEPMGPEVSAWHGEAGLFAGGFRAGDIVLCGRRPVNHFRGDKNLTYVPGVSVDAVLAAIRERLARAHG